jgi:hypothetical protein
MGALGFEPRLAGIFYTRGLLSALPGCDEAARRSLFIDISIPTRHHSRAIGARSTARLYYTPKGKPSQTPSLF